MTRKTLAAGSAAALLAVPAVALALGPPSAGTTKVEKVGPRSAVLTASVHPNGLPTQVRFDYGTSTAYGQLSGRRDVGAGTSQATVKIGVGSLAPGTVYHYRAVATNSAGTTRGGDRTFRTAPNPAPAVSTGGVTGVSGTGATVKGTVNPRGADTLVAVEYGAGRKLTAASAAVPIGNGTKGVPIKIALSGLQPVTKHSYRLVATSAAGTAHGKTRTFTTKKQPPSAVLAATPAVVRAGASATLAGTVGGTGAGGARVVLERREYPYTAPFSSAGNPITAAPNGGFATLIAPAVSTQYRAIVTVADGKKAASPVLTVGVAPAVSLHARRDRHGRVRFSGVLEPRVDAVVRLQRLTRSGRAITIRRTVAARGVYRFAKRRLRHTARYRVHVTPATGAYTATDSHARRIRRSR